MVKPKPSNSIDFRQANACELPFPDASFDVVLAVECIFHFPSREQFFQEAYRVLKPGGYLALSDFVSHPFIKPFARVKVSEMFGPGFYGKCNLQYGVNEYRNLAKQCQFSISTERDITANTIPTYPYIRKLAPDYRIDNIHAFYETAAAEILSRFRLLQYYIYGFCKA